MLPLNHYFYAILTHCLPSYYPQMTLYLSKNHDVILIQTIACNIAFLFIPMKTVN